MHAAVIPAEARPASRVTSSDGFGVGRGMLETPSVRLQAVRHGLYTWTDLVTEDLVGGETWRSGEIIRTCSIDIVYTW